jgi:hypothetical protein
MFNTRNQPTQPAQLGTRQKLAAKLSERKMKKHEKYQGAVTGRKLFKKHKYAPATEPTLLQKVKMTLRNSLKY